MYEQLCANASSEANTPQSSRPRRAPFLSTTAQLRTSAEDMIESLDPCARDIDGTTGGPQGSSGASTVLRVPPAMRGARASQNETQLVAVPPGKKTLAQS